LPATVCGKWASVEISIEIINKSIALHFLSDNNNLTILNGIRFDILTTSWSCNKQKEL